MKGRYFSAIIRPSKFREDGRILEELEEKKEKKRITVLLTLLAILLAILVTIIIFLYEPINQWLKPKKKQPQLPKLLLI